MDIRDVDQKDVEAIGKVGADSFLAFSRKYKPEEAYILDEKYKAQVLVRDLKKRLLAWETGHKLIFPFAVFASLIIGLICYFTSSTLISIWRYFELSTALLCAFAGISLTLQLVNMFDTGRLFMLFFIKKKDMALPKQPDIPTPLLEKEDRLLRYFLMAHFEVFAAGKMQNKDVMAVCKAKGLSPTTKALGAVLTQLFDKRITKKNTLYLIRQRHVSKQPNPSSTQMVAQQDSSHSK